MALSDILKKAAEGFERFRKAVFGSAERFSETMAKEADAGAEDPPKIHFETITVINAEPVGLPPVREKHIVYKSHVWYLAQFAKKKRIRKKNLKRWEREYESEML